MSRLRTRIDRLELTRASKSPIDWRFEDYLAAINVVLMERTDKTLDPLLVAFTREVLEPDRQLWEQLPISERGPGWMDKLSRNDGTLGT
jgi:caffeoyl-CoA O-methyltransferase